MALVKKNIYYLYIIKESILFQISELNQEGKFRLYKVIGDFLWFDNEVDITKE